MRPTFQIYTKFNTQGSVVQNQISTNPGFELLFWDLQGFSLENS